MESDPARAPPAGAWAPRTRKAGMSARSRSQALAVVDKGRGRGFARALQPVDRLFGLARRAEHPGMVEAAAEIPAPCAARA